MTKKKPGLFLGRDRKKDKKPSVTDIPIFYKKDFHRSQKTG